MLNNEKITKIIARRYIWLPFLMGVLLGIVCFVVFTGYDRMKIEKIADETLDFMQDRVKKYDDYKNNDKVKSLYRLADKTLELDQRLEEKDADQEELVERYMKDQRLDGVLLIDENLNCVYQAEDVGKMDTFWQEQMSEPAVKNMLEQPRKTYITRLDKEGKNYGFVDAIVERKDLKMTLYRILKMHQKTEGYANFDPLRSDDCYEPTEVMKERATKAQPLSAWEKVRAARRADRLASVDYIDNIFDDFMEFHGDRQFADDPAIVGGVAYLDGQPVTVIGIHKGKDLKDCMRHNYGMPSPEGYRKALRLMKQAEKFNRPIITFVNTSGAFCGKEAEERGQGEAIARNLYEMSAIKVPILCLMIGEGGSGGALALSVGNEVWMLENATYSVLSPEGFASILWKDGKRAKEASEVMKITAHDLYALNIVEQVIPEYGTADEKACESISRYMKGHMKEFLERQNGKTGEQLAEERYARFRAF